MCLRGYEVVVFLDGGEGDAIHLVGTQEWIVGCVG